MAADRLGGRGPKGALRVYNMPTVSTISRPRLPVVHSVYRPQTALPLCRVLLNRRGGAECCLREGGGGRVLLKRGGGAECCLRHCTTRRTVSYKASGPDASGMYDASYSVVQGVGARRVGDVRRVGRCRGPTRRKIPISTVVTYGAMGNSSHHQCGPCLALPVGCRRRFIRADGAMPRSAAAANGGPFLKPPAPHLCVLQNATENSKIPPN